MTNTASKEKCDQLQATLSGLSKDERRIFDAVVTSLMAAGEDYVVSLTALEALVKVMRLSMEIDASC